jgi:hypothetical protein
VQPSRGPADIPLPGDGGEALELPEIDGEHADEIRRCPKTTLLERERAVDRAKAVWETLT